MYYTLLLALALATAAADVVMGKSEGYTAVAFLMAPGVFWATGRWFTGWRIR